MKGKVAWIIHGESDSRDEIVYREPDPWSHTVESETEPGTYEPARITKIAFFELED